MQRQHAGLLNFLLIAALVVGLSGCTVIFQKGRRTDIEKISKLKNDLTELERAKQELERRLQDEINNKISSGVALFTPFPPVLHTTFPHLLPYLLA